MNKNEPTSPQLHASHEKYSQQLCTEGRSGFHEQLLETNNPPVGDKSLETNSPPVGDK